MMKTNNKIHLIKKVSLYRGGARIGLSNITYPFAKIKIEESVLILNASIIGKLMFLPQNVLAIEKNYGLFSEGVRIIHNVENYPKKVIFWCIGDSEELLSKLRSFFNLKSNTSNENLLDEVKSIQQRGVFPLKKIVFFLLGGYILAILFDAYVLLAQLGWISKLLNFRYYDIFSFSMLFSGLGCLYFGLIIIIPLSRDFFIKKGHKFKDFRFSIFLLFFYFLVFSYFCHLAFTIFNK